jgi:D-serine deaminase-like pyridoxal phosphate-dependent protein
MNWSYESLKVLVQGRRLPVVLVDQDRFDANVQRFVTLAARHGKTVRIASKSLRVPALLQRAISAGGSVTRGVMCYSAAEAVYLAEQGFDDLLVAYPAIQPAELAAVSDTTRAGKTITLIIDSPEQAQRLAEVWRALAMPSPLPVGIELDVSWRSLGQHVGAQRSPVRSLNAFEQLLDRVLDEPVLAFAGVMAYEAQLAGVPDDNPFTRWRNLAIRAMKRFSRPDVAQQRRSLDELLKRRGVAVRFFNGGGTGSFADSVQEPWLTEVTVGSGLLQSHLFDYYRGAIGEPAICFALAVTRTPQPDRITCHGGGFIASGTPGNDRSPIAILPDGLRVDPREGYGEVQTPLIVPAWLRGRIQIGEPIFFRPAKAGEIAERFATYCLVASEQIVAEVPTYRGLGQCFH